MAGNAQSSKGNPATKRMMNPRRKARRLESWLRGEERKRRNRAENEARARVNAEHRAQGLPTHSTKGAKACPLCGPEAA